MSSIWGYTVFFEAENPAALQEITAVMLETARKGYWKATEEQLKEISGLHVRFISEHGPACSGFVCDNQKLQKFVISHIPENGREVYQEQLDRTREVQTEHRQNAVVLKKRGFLSAGARKPEYLNRSETCIYRDADRWDTIGFSGNLEAEKKDK